MEVHDTAAARRINDYTAGNEGATGYWRLVITPVIVMHMMNENIRDQRTLFTVVSSIFHDEFQILSEARTG